MPYYEECVPTGAFPNNGGGETAAKDDFDFYALAGQIEGDPASAEGRGFLDLRAAEEGARQGRHAVSLARIRSEWMPGLTIPWRCRLPPNRATRLAAAATNCGGGWHPSRCSAWRGRSRAACRSISPFRPSPTTVAAFFEMVADGSHAEGLSADPAAAGHRPRRLGRDRRLGRRRRWACARASEWPAAPVFIVLQAAPVAALIPLVTFVYGIGLTAKVHLGLPAGAAGHRAQQLQGGRATSIRR